MKPLSRDQGRGRSHKARPRSPTVAAVLSFLWPGLGQWYMGRRVSTMLYAVPPLLIVAGLLSLTLGGLEALAGRLFDPTIALVVLAGIVVLASWRVAAMVHAWWLARRRERKLRRYTPSGGKTAARLGVLTSLLAIVLVVHAVPATWAWAFYRAGTVIFQPPAQTSDVALSTFPPSIPAASLAPGTSVAPGTSPGPVGSFDVPASPIPTRPPPQVSDDGFETFLFVGIDATPDRRPDHRLTDSMILASFDRRDRSIQMISIPRNITRFPRYWGGMHDQKLNTLLLEAQTHPELYPDGPMGTLVAQISFLLGVEIDHYASVDIPGFERLVTVLGGVDVVVTEPIADPTWDLYLEPGPYHLDGPTAVDYVRARRGPGGSNEARSIRQQELLLQLRRKFSDPALITRLPEVLDAVAATVRTNLPPDGLDEALTLARESQGAAAGQLWLGPPHYAVEIPTSDIDLEYATELRMDQVAALSLELWGSASRYSDASYHRALVGVPKPES